MKRSMMIWTGQSFSVIGSAMVQLTIIWWITLTYESASTLALADIMGFLPQIVLTPIAEAYVDRWDRCKVMIASDGFVAATTVVLVLLFLKDVVESWRILAVLAFGSASRSFHWPAAQAATTMLVPERQLTGVQELNQSIFGLSSITSPPVASVLYAFVEIGWILCMDIATALMAMIPLLIVTIPSPTRKAVKGMSIYGDMREAFQYIMGWMGLSLVLVLFMLANLLLVPAFSLQPLLVVDHFGGDAIDFASVEALAGIGTLVSGIILGIWGGTKRKIITVMGAMTLAGVGMTVIGLIPSDVFLMLLGVVFFVGTMFPVLNGAINGMLRSFIPPGMQGRVFAMLGSLAMAMSPVGLAIGGPLADAYGVQIWFIISGVFMGVAGIVALLVAAVLHIEDEMARNGAVDIKP
ncbi:MAG: MFS transporter [Euryarchaeota archaeon]|nr:MFS transporter [Euryarchaeota archaeon]